MRIVRTQSSCKISSSISGSMFEYMYIFILLRIIRDQFQLILGLWESSANDSFKRKRFLWLLSAKLLRISGFLRRNLNFQNWSICWLTICSKIRDLWIFSVQCVISRARISMQLNLICIYKYAKKCTLQSKNVGVPGKSFLTRTTCICT